MSFSNYRTSNPVFTNYLWSKGSRTKSKMSLFGLFYKSFISLVLLSITLWYVWDLVYQGVNVRWYTSGGLLAAIIFSILTSYRKKWAPITTPLYALSKGLFLGGFSAYINRHFEGFPMQAVQITVITLFIMLLLYQWHIIKVTKKFRSIVFTVTFTIMMIYIISWILSFFGVTNQLIYGTSWFAILFTVVAAIFAALTLLLDFDFIDRKLGKAPKYMEWVAVWGLLVSLIWLYVEVLRLMKKLAIRF
jgi:uncharacterized YccA/Bax inhibitor family protein